MPGPAGGCSKGAYDTRKMAVSGGPGGSDYDCSRGGEVEFRGCGLEWGCGLRGLGGR